MPPLQPTPKSRTREHSASLERRLKSLKAGDIESVHSEGRTIQNRLPKTKFTSTDHESSRAFAKLMFHGKTKAALRLITEQNAGGVLHLDSNIGTDAAPRSVHDVLLAKHPPGQHVSTNALYSTTTEPPTVHPVVLEAIDETTIKAAALRTDGAAGLSGIDARGWRRLCASFQAASADLCHSLALLARRLSTEFVDPEGLSAFLGFRLITLDKNKGGVGSMRLSLSN